ncbi:MAG: head maturation protease, ClpP-related [Limnohabitans sp.]
MKTITLSGDIGWEITPEMVRNELAAADGGDVEISISSRGGLVGAALEIYNMLKNYPGQVTAVLSGYAMSAASYIPMAADKVIAEDNAVMMIHNAQGVAIGDHNEMAKFSGILKGLSGLLAGAYASFTGKPRKEIDALMDAETWLYGEDIVAAGFASETREPAKTDENTATCLADATAAGRLHFENLQQRMSVAKQTVNADISQAAAMAKIDSTAGASIPPPPHSVRAKNLSPQQSTKEPIMDLKTLKEKHSELVAAITEEATAGLTEKITAAKREGAEAERQRIADVRAQAIPGHEALIETLAADGKTTGPEAAMAIVAAEKKLRATAAGEALTGNPPATAAGDAAPAQKTMKRADWQKMTAIDQRAFVASGGTVVD